MMPRWVEADPTREVAVDALGLTRQADELADALLPELSVLTRRARYLSFLLWAVTKTRGSPSPERAIHGYEGQLALHEAKTHDSRSIECPGVIGRRSVLREHARRGGHWPQHPERLFKSTAFRAYRPLLISTGLLEPSAQPKVTVDGARLATEFGRRARGACACLSRISGAEISCVRRALGFDLRRAADGPAAARRATYLELKRNFAGVELSPETVLPRYPRRPAVSAKVPFLLHQAYVWEVLTAGLNLAFISVLSEMHIGPMARQLALGRRRRRVEPTLSGKFSVADPQPADRVIALVQHGLSLRPRELGLEAGVVEIAELLCNATPAEFLGRLVSRHQMVKGNEAWVRATGAGEKLVRLAPPSKELPTEFRLHPYRLNAFWNLAKDLKLW